MSGKLKRGHEAGQLLISNADKFGPSFLCRGGSTESVSMAHHPNAGVSFIVNKNEQANPLSKLNESNQANRAEINKKPCELKDNFVSNENVKGFIQLSPACGKSDGPSTSVTPCELSPNKDQSEVLPANTLPSLSESALNTPAHQSQASEMLETPLTQFHSETPKEIIIRQIKAKPGPQVMINVTIENQTIESLVDPGAQVTIISEKLYKSFRKNIPVLGSVKLRMACGDQVHMGILVGPLKIRIGSRWYSRDVYVSSLTENMIIGTDILCNPPDVCESVIDFIRGVMYFDGQVIVGRVIFPEEKDQTAQVFVKKRRVIPPNSWAHVKCKLSCELPDYIVEPYTHKKFLAPRTLYKSKSQPVIRIVNVLDRPLILPRGVKIGTAVPISSVDPISVSDPIPVSVDTPKSTCSPDPIIVSSISSPDPVPIDSVPEHVRSTFNNSKNELSPDQQSCLAQLLSQYGDVFASSEYDLGDFTAIEHSIDTEGARPIKQRMRRTPPGFAEEEEAHLKKMLDAGVIQESSSDWAAPPVLIRKRDGSVRWCIDYRALNDVTIKDVYPLPLVDECLDTLAGSVWFSKLDANSAYWQIKIREKDRKKTAFITKYGLYEHVRMGFGLCNAPATYARVMGLVLRGLTWKTCLAFLDDILVLGSSFEDHLSHLKEIFERFRHHGLKLKP